MDCAGRSGLFFGLGHFYQPLGVVTTFAIGLLLAAIYEWRRTLLANVLLHGMYNSVSAMVILATVWTNANAPAIGILFSREGQDQVLVERVLPGSPAEKADLRAGDVILQYNGSDVTDYNQLVRLIRAGKVGDTATLEILRDGTQMSKRLTLSSPADWN